MPRGRPSAYAPYFRIRSDHVAAYAQVDRLRLRVFMTQGIYDFDVENTRQLADIFPEKKYPLLYLETADGHCWGNVGCLQKRRED